MVPDSALSASTSSSPAPELALGSHRTANRASLAPVDHLDPQSLTALEAQFARRAGVQHHVGHELTDQEATVSTRSPASQSASRCFAIAASFRDAARLRFEHEPVSHRVEMVLDGLCNGRNRGPIMSRQWFILDAIGAQEATYCVEFAGLAGGNAFSTQ